MSFSVKKNAITLTRGDTFVCSISITKDGEPYTPEPQDVIRFALKHNTMNSAKTAYVDTEPILTKIVPNDTLILRLESQDTKNLMFEDYVYDMQITFADGTVYTFITPTLFKITPEVD